MSDTDRRNFIGGSDVAAILGCSPWRTPLDVFFEKTSGVLPEPTPEKLKIFNRGKTLEPYVLNIFENETGLKASARNRRYMHPKIPYLSAEVDAETAEGENIEIKTTSSFRAADWGTPGTDEVPIYYATQAMHGLSVTGRNVCHFGVLVGLDDFRVYRVERDDTLIDAINKKVEEFWGMVKAGTPPEPKTSDDILKLFPQDGGCEIEASNNIIEVYNELKTITNTIKSAESRKRDLEEIIKTYMRNSSVLTIEGRPVVTWKAQSRSFFDSQKLQEDMPNVAEIYKHVKSFRVFRMR